MGIIKTMSKKTFSDELRRAVEQSGMTRYEIYKRTGIDQAVLSKFVHGERGVSLDTVDTLCECLGLRLVAEGTIKPKKTRKRG